MKKALITGITGQDGSYLTEFLLDKGYEVHGIIRRGSTYNLGRIDAVLKNPKLYLQLYLHYGDLTDSTSLRKIIDEVRPDEVYNLGAQSHVKVSFDTPEYTADVVAIGTLRLLEAVRAHISMFNREVRIYQAGSSEMFGAAPPPQRESTEFYPRSPYAVSKVAGYWYAKNYRESYGMYIVNGILFNHESPRRGETFVTRKITRAVGRIKEGLQDKLFLGNLDAKRDWGFAGDYVEAMWLMLQQESPEDFVVATGVAHSVRDFLKEAFSYVNLNWEDYVEIDPKLFRPAEIDYLLGDPTKIKEKLNWEPKVSFKELVAMMVEHDWELAKREKALKEVGYTSALRGVTIG